MPASGAVSSMMEAAITRVWGSAARPSRPARRCAARSPKLLPSATKTRSGLDGKVARDPLKIRCEIAQISDGALELGLAGRGFAGPFGQRIGVRPALGGAGSDLFDLSGQRVDRIALLGCCCSDGLGVATGLAGGSHDGIECPRRVGAELLHAGHDVTPASHLPRDSR